VQAALQRALGLNGRYQLKGRTDGRPVVALAAKHELEDADQVVRALADVLKAHDLGHFRNTECPFQAQLLQPC